MTEPPARDAVLAQDSRGAAGARIEFARDTLNSIQQLIQQMDQKSYLVLVIVGVTTAVFFAIIGPALQSIRGQLSAAVLIPVMSAWFLIEAGLVLWFSLKSIQGVLAKATTLDAPGMIFPNSLLKRYGDDAQAYYERLHALDIDDILKDYSSEIVKTSTIYVEKFQQVAKAINALARSMIPWLIGILATLIVRQM